MLLEAEPRPQPRGDSWRKSGDVDRDIGAEGLGLQPLTSVFVLRTSNLFMVFAGT